MSRTILSAIAAAAMASSAFAEGASANAPCAASGAAARVPVVVSEKSGAAVQRAIDAVAAAGGGRVVLPAGEYPSPSLRLRSGVELRLERGAVLKGSSNPLDYAKSADHLERAGFLQAWDEKDLAITGEGTVEIDGFAFFDTSAADLWGGYFHPYEGPRPEMLQLIRCRGIRLEGVTFRNAPMWSLRLRLCENVVADGIRVLSDQRFINSDGVDFDGCRHVVLRNSTFVTGDDCVILRAVPEPGATAPIVTEDVLVENCDLDSACQAVRIGCPSDDVIRNATFRNLRAKGKNGIFFDNPLHYVSDDDEGRMDASNIVFEGFRGDFTGVGLRVSVAPGIRLRGIRDVLFKDFELRSAGPLEFVGNVHTPIERIRRENFTFNGQRLPDGEIAVDRSNAEPFRRANVKRVQITRPRKDGLNLPGLKRSY